MVRGGAGKLLNNVMDTVKTYTKSDLDIDYITSKIAGTKLVPSPSINPHFVPNPESEVFQIFLGKNSILCNF